MSSLLKVSIETQVAEAMMIKAILWDLDGTLLDTTEGVKFAVKKTISQLNLHDLDSRVLDSFVGPPMQESFMKHYGMEANRALEVANLFRKIYKEESLFKAKLYPNTLETLATLKERGFLMGIATNKSHDNAVAIVDYFGIASFCDYVLGSDLSGKLKKADIIAKCLNQLKVTSKDTVYIGDSIYDLEGAEKQGIHFIGVDYGFGFRTGESIGYKLLNSMKAIEEELV